VEPYRTVVEELYVKMDDLVGRTLPHIDDQTLLVVLSDHGFESFQRGVNLNTWLREQGYLALVDGAEECPDFFQNVDWERTRAYAVGLGGVYLNRRGREARGVVPNGEEAEALKRELAARLRELRDTERDCPAITDIQISSEVYRGPYLDEGPDLLIGYNRGYRAAWAAVTGGVTRHVFEDNDKAWGGDHCIDPRHVPGVLFANRPLLHEDPGLEDLAPSALSLFGLEPPAHMEGRALF
jgi:predicted AlkP superfamily phosphohydrolase/phosphomutase